MSRTDISAASLADYLRRKAGDGGIEWCYEPMQTSVLLDIADMLDENAKLRELVNGYEALTATLCNERECGGCPFDITEQVVCEHMRLQTCLSELGVEVSE